MQLPQVRGWHRVVEQQPAAIGGSTAPAPDRASREEQRGRQGGRQEYPALVAPLAQGARGGSEAASPRSSGITRATWAISTSGASPRSTTTSAPPDATRAGSAITRSPRWFGARMTVRPGNTVNIRYSPTLSTARKASCGISTEPTCFIRFLPSFCFSSSFRFRVMSPP